MEVVFKIALLCILIFFMTCDGIFANIAIRQKLAKQKAECQKSHFYNSYKHMDLREQTKYLKSIGCKFAMHNTRFSNIDIDQKVNDIIKG